MRLYQTELYKLCHRKLFPIGSFLILAVMLFLFCQQLSAVRSTVNGITYHGYEAVRIDRQITEAYKGILTDDRIQQIVEQYGFPHQVERYYGVADGNFLNRFVMTYASDGYLYSWEDYRLATTALPLVESELGLIREHTGEEIYFAYYGGWNDYTEWYYFGIMMTSILILCLVSTTFSQERQFGTKPLLFTTQEGPARDIFAKLAAAFTLSAGLWLTVTIFSLSLYGSIYGWDGMRCLAVLVVDLSEPMIPFGILLIKATCLSLLGIMELCALALCLSARCASMFHSVIAAALVWALPLALQVVPRAIIDVLLAASLSQSALTAWGAILFVFQMLLYAMPFYMIASHAIVSELDAVSSNQGVPATGIVICIAAATIVLCISSAWRRYRAGKP